MLVMMTCCNFFKYVSFLFVLIASETPATMSNLNTNATLLGKNTNDELAENEENVAIVRVGVIDLSKVCL